MEESWEIVFSSRDLYRVEILKTLLEEKNIKGVIMNKKDSSYNFGDILLYVKREDILNAKRIINKFLGNE